MVEVRARRVGAERNVVLTESKRSELSYADDTTLVPLAATERQSDTLGLPYLITTHLPPLKDPGKLEGF